MRFGHREELRVIGWLPGPLGDPKRPVQRGSIWYSGCADGLDVAWPYAFVAYGGRGLDVFDVTDPARIVRVGGFGTGPASAFRVQVVGDRACLAANALRVLKKVLDEEIGDKRGGLDYIDLRFGNKVFYK